VVIGIGDGANDVGMILEADIGVGVQGVEGSQAVNNADFAICQFQHLANLVLVHGRWSYYRIAKAVCYFFYKNIVNVFTIMWYALITGFSGTLQYNDMVLCSYNLVFTSFPVISYALLEQDVGYQRSLKTPEMYEPGQHSKFLNTGIFFLWVAEALYAATIMFWVPFGAWAVTPDGLDVPLTFVGLIMYSINVLVVTVRLGFLTQYWTYIHGITYLGSVFLWVLFCFVEFAVPGGIITSGMYWDSYNTFSTPYAWLCLVLGAWVALLPSFVVKCYQDCFQPSINEQTRQLNLENDERDAEKFRMKVEDQQNMTAETEEWRRTQTRGNMEAPDAGANVAHVLQGRAHALKHVHSTITTAKAISKFKGLSKSFKNRKKAAGQ
jgi:phospholipid-translocating ATPase